MINIIADSALVIVSTLVVALLFRTFSYSLQVDQDAAMMVGAVIGAALAPPRN
jgi:hypothetical protein